MLLGERRGPSVLRRALSSALRELIQRGPGSLQPEQIKRIVGVPNASPIRNLKRSG
jgi:hypothetical protein